MGCFGAERESGKKKLLQLNKYGTFTITASIFKLKKSLQWMLIALQQTEQTLFTLLLWRCVVWVHNVCWMLGDNIAVSCQYKQAFLSENKQYLHQNIIVTS